MDSEAILEELLDQWEDALENGRNMEPEELCKDCPEFIAPLRKKIRAIQEMNGCFDAHETSAEISEKNPNENEAVEIDSKLVNLSFHDRGGLGVVYKARDEELHRDVAIKFLNQRIARNETDRMRFHQEAEITGRLDHPGVVPVYATGETDLKQPFYVMRFIRGDTYDDAIKFFHKNKSDMNPAEQRVSMQKLLVQLASVCKTIGYAHTRGIVHRDIKPKNIMLGKYGETLVVDWGIAIPFQREGQFRVKDEKTLVPNSIDDTNSNRDGEGTPVFMSPEQAAGNPNLGPASDIYSLGTVLYRALTGKFAFDGESPFEIKKSIMQGDFKPPRSLDSSIPPELESICLNSMSLEPEHRYSTAIAMAEDLENFLAEAPVTSYQYSSREKAGRFVAQNQTLFTTLMMAAMLLAGVLLFSTTKLFQLQRDTSRSLQAAALSQKESLNMTCLMTARSIQYNLEARLIAMEELADSPEMIRRVENWEEIENRSNLAEILRENRKAFQNRLPSVSWFILDREGDLICRAADDEQLQPKNPIRHKLQPYFHGGEIVLKNDNSSPKPIQKPCISPVYFGPYENRHLCSISVPIKTADEVIGVLAMTIKMGQFEPLIESDTRSTNSQDQRFASLVESLGELKGSLLHHPGIKDMSAAEVAQVFVCESVFNSLKQIDRDESTPHELEGYVDPLGDEYAGKWLSFAMPIQIRSRDNSSVSCGWYLMVQDRPFGIE